jgi:4-amino-4-deoxy-L-arabinose transferase-like glycosyltransferase
VVAAIKGRRELKFVVLWLYVVLIPFCLIRLPEGWLELRYVYFAAAPFCALLASAAAEVFVRSGRPIRVLVVTVLLAAVVMSSYVVRALEKQYDARGKNAVKQKRVQDTHPYTPEGKC